MSKIITIGRRLVSTDNIAYVEEYDPKTNPNLETRRDFKARLVLLNPRDSVLVEETVEDFAKAHAFRVLAADKLATNPVVSFKVERFTSHEEFEPEKPYVSRLRWRDALGREQSKLLLTDGEAALESIMGAEPEKRSDNHINRRHKKAVPVPT